MKTIVVIVMDDVCAKNGRDPEAKLLIEKAKLYGEVQTGDAFLASEKAKSQVVINNLTTQLDAIKEKNVTPAELEILRALRQKAANEGKVYEEEIAALKGQLEKVVEESESRAKAIKAILE